MIFPYSYRRKPIIRRSESLGYCFSFDGTNDSLDVDDSFHGIDLVSTEMISKSISFEVTSRIWS